MKKTNYVTVKFFMMCWVVFIFASLLNAAEISQEAKRHMARGTAAMKYAKSATDYQDAVTEFKKAIEYAPDWSDAWFNLGVAQESADDFAGSIKSFRTYLEKNPKAADRDKVETRIYELEYRQEKAQKDTMTKKKEVTARMEKEQNDKDIAGRMAGIWETPTHKGQRYKVETSGNKFELYLISYDNYRRHTKKLWYYGTVQDGNISGYYNLGHDMRFEQITASGRTYSCHTPAGAHPMDRGSLSPDGTRLTLHHILKDINPNCNIPPNEIKYVFIRVQ